jgi:hypothetical protein
LLIDAAVIEHADRRELAGRTQPRTRELDVLGRRGGLTSSACREQ